MNSTLFGPIGYLYVPRHLYDSYHILVLGHVVTIQ